MVKGKEIKDPLREGQPAKIYLAAFTKPMTGYGLAKKVFGAETYYIEKSTGREEKTRVKQTNRPYEIANENKELFERLEEEGKNKIFSKVEPFLNKLEKNLNNGNNGLTESERKQLKEYLEGPFRKAIQEKYLNVNYRREVDAYSEILGILISVLWVESHARHTLEFLEIHKEDLPGSVSKEEAKKNIYESWQDEMPKDLGVAPFPASDDEILNPVKDFSDELLEKLMDTDLGGSKDVLRKYLRFVNKTLNKINKMFYKKQ